MKTINLKYVDFWNGFDYKDDIIFRFLNNSKEFIVNIVDDNPDYIVFSMFGKENFKYDCVKIFYTGEEFCPDFNLCDYAIGFDYIEFQDRYIRYPLYYTPHYEKDYLMMMNRKVDDNNRGFCSFVYSNNNADYIRNLFFEKLSAYKAIASGGKVFNNQNGPVKDKIAFERQYKFSIAFENCSHPGYTTEKIVQAFASGGIPIYWGNPLIGKEFNTKAFINLHDFESIDDCIQYIIKVDTDDELYKQMISQQPKENLATDKLEIEKKLDAFLKNIFDQDVEKAFRRTRECHNQKYTKMMSENYKVYVNSSIISKIKDRIFGV